MGGYVGSALLAQWVHSAGTLQLDVDYRTFNYTPSASFLEETAGAATSQEFLLSFKGGQASVGGVMQAGSLHIYGSALAAGALGTLRFAPEGTAAGKYKGTIAAFSQGFVYNTAYNAIVEWTCGFMQTGALSDGTAAASW